jgi:heat-inducible transcriptional repressor
MRAIVELMEDKNALVHLVGNVKPEDGIRITIGEEAHFEPLRHLSVISSALKMGDNIGTMSIIGPTRMNYSKLCAIIEYTTKTIERQLNR